MPDIIERYLDAITSHDWDALRGCVTDEIVRVGPYGDRYEGKDAYVTFIADTMPKLEGYEMQVDRVTYANHTLAFAELSETVNLNGKPHRTPEVLVFELADDGRIAHVEVFIQTHER